LGAVTAVAALLGTVELRAQEPTDPNGSDRTLPDAGDSRLGASPAEQADTRVATETPARPPVIRVLLATPPPRVDGQLNDIVWRNAARITSFVQEQPVEGAPASEETEVHVAYDSRNIYFGIYARYSDPSMIRANRVDRDRTGGDDRVTIVFDPFLDQQRGYTFSVNAYGIQGDSLIRGGGGGFGGGYGGGYGGPGDESWNALFISAGILVEDGWTAEIAIPFKSLRYPSSDNGQEHRWGFQIQRRIQGKDETAVWAPTSRGVMGILSQMGVLEGMSDLSMSRNLELLPTVTAIQSQSLDETGAYGGSGVQEGGVSVKYGITSNLTLDFAANPDFSQIELDRQQIDVNQRFPLFFAELRPFFLEGKEIFRLAGPLNLVHTRTMIDPQFGAKITGKVGKMTMGFLVANDEGPGKIDDQNDPAFGQKAQFAIARLRYDFRPESSIGIIVTDREFVDQYSRVGGVDGQLRIGSNQRAGFRAITSRHRDVDGVQLNGNVLDFGYRKEGRNLRFSGNYFSISPGFRTDTGFIRRVNQRRVGGDVSYRWWPESWVRSFGPRVSYSQNHTHAGTLQDRKVGVRTRFNFAQSINFNVNVNREMERFLDVDFEKTRYGFGGMVGTSQRFGFGGFFNRGDSVRYVEDPFLGYSSSANIFMSFRPFSRLQSDLNITTSRFTDVRTDIDLFDIKIYRSQTSYQLSERLLFRSILEFNDYDRTLGGNLLLTYRVNSGTVFFVGYDDRYQEGSMIDVVQDQTSDLRRINRSFFTKLQILFRH
jgi:hypothetical protein